MEMKTAIVTSLVSAALANAFLLGVTPKAKFQDIYLSIALGQIHLLLDPEV